MIPADFIAAELHKARGPSLEMNRMIAASVGYAFRKGAVAPPDFTGNVQAMLALVPLGWGAYLIYRECDQTYCAALHEFKPPFGRLPADAPFFWNKHGLALALGEAIFTLRAQQ